jgi:hypothetical protein
MRTLIKFVAACLAITAIVSVVKRRSPRAERPERVVVSVPEPPDPPAMVEAPADVVHPPGEAIRIVTTNGSAFLSLRGDLIVAGLSDSVRAIAQQEIDKSLAKDSSASVVGRAIANAVVGGVKNLLKTELTVPLRELEDVQYEDGRIEFRYSASSKRHITFDDFKSDRQEFLAQFPPDQAREFAVRVRAKLGKH